MRSAYFDENSMCLRRQELNLYGKMAKILIVGRSKIPVFSMVTAGAAILLFDIEIAIAVWKKEEEQDGQGHLTVLEIVGIVLAVIGNGYAIVT